MKTHRLDMPFFSINTKAMNIPQEYADIRPFQPEELPAAFNQLLSDPEFLSILPHVFNGVPVEAIKAQLHTCTDTLDFQKKFVYAIVKKILAEKNLPYHINYVSSLGSLFFTEQEVVDYTSAKSSDTKAFSEYFKGMLAQGIHMAPSQFEAMFLSVAHTDEIIDQTLEAVRNYFTK